MEQQQIREQDGEKGLKRDTTHEGGRKGKGKERNRLH